MELFCRVSLPTDCEAALDRHESPASRPVVPWKQDLAGVEINGYQPPVTPDGHHTTTAIVAPPGRLCAGQEKPGKTPSTRGSTAVRFIRRQLPGYHRHAQDAGCPQMGGLPSPD